MMFPTEEQEVETLFYLIKKKIELQKNKKKTEYIYVPISNKEIEYDFLKRSEYADLENYLWYFTGNWPTIYELKDKKGKTNIQIVGQTPVYEKINTIYKTVIDNKEEASKEFKLIKALFIIQSNMEQEYKFKTAIDENGKLNFYYNHNQIKYETLTEFIKNHEYTIYEKIINLCDLMCTDIIMTVDKRLIDLIIRRGAHENTQYHIKETYKLKEYFDNLLGYNLYNLFPEIKENL